MANGTVEAIVQTEGIETTYVRAGAGAPVVLLRASETPAEHDPVVAQLAREFRVFAPDLSCSAGAQCFSGWLRGLIEGLGLEEPRLIVTASSEEELAALLQRLRD